MEGGRQTLGCSALMPIQNVDGGNTPITQGCPESDLQLPCTSQTKPEEFIIHPGEN